MSQFSGFPSKTRFTPIPNLFFSRLLSEISDIAELKVTLYIFWALYPKRGYPRLLTYRELSGDKNLMSSLGKGSEPFAEVLRNALEMAVKRGTILHLNLEKDGVRDDVYLLNTEPDREVAAKIQRGELVLSGLKAARQPFLEPESEPPNIFTLYEENIGMLTPMIAEELREAEKLYPEAWIRDAIKEAVSLGKRNWRHIARILERWAVEGRNDGTYRRDIKKTDTDKYIKGKYGHMVRR